MSSTWSRSWAKCFVGDVSCRCKHVRFTFYVARRCRPLIRGKRFVVKLGGEIMLNHAGLDALAADIVTCW